LISSPESNMNHSFDNIIVPALLQRNLHLSVEYVKSQG
jgi:hypothetical protein